MFKKLALLYPKAIGDFVFLLPALHTLRRGLPGTRIILVVKQKQAPLAVPQCGSLVDEVLAIGEKQTWLSVRRRLSALAPDLIADLAGNDLSGLLLAGRRGRRVRPHRSGCRGHGALYAPFAESLPRLPPGTHRVDELLRYACHLSQANAVYSFGLSFPDAAVEACEGMVERYRLREGSVIVLNVGASRSTKRWPVSHFFALAEALVARGHRVVFTGAREFPSDGHYDRAVSEQLERQGKVDGERCIDLITEGNLAAGLQLQRDAHFLRYSGVPRVVVGNDTGPLHLAGAVGEDAKNRTLSLFGPTHWGRYAPYDPTRRFPDRPAGDWNRVVQAKLDCLPAGTEEACRCYRRGCRRPEFCMSALSPGAVLEAVLERLGEGLTAVPSRA